ncbi:serine/threonine-protein kinase CLA4-like [Pyrgilauda ruficollis]|uniref:serine/threonine-protein kinase CLA4-like n=1 Tax=Pyrgilauda ruficollis TaxID=221976 RepID=UPI001B87A259|nr:serine/threonine-protein kinase CLA4-like [Pyrgilauda ruficollis]
MRVRRRGREGPAPSLVPAGAAGEPPRPRASTSFGAARSFMSTEPQHHVHGSGSVSLRAERRRLNPCRAAPGRGGRGSTDTPGSRPGSRLAPDAAPGHPSRWGEAGPVGPLRETRTPREQTPPHRSPTQPNRQQTSTCSTAGNARAPKDIIALTLNSHTLQYVLILSIYQYKVLLLKIKWHINYINL